MGSVTAPTNEPAMASTNPQRPERKNGAMRARRCFNGNRGKVMERDYRGRPIHPDKKHTLARRSAPIGRWVVAQS
jgi:hypothetical protein